MSFLGWEPLDDKIDYNHANFGDLPPSTSFHRASKASLKNLKWNSQVPTGPHSAE